jgi:replicative DNA helicase
MNAELKLPPHSVESEQSVIGGLMISPKAWDDVVGVVTDADFYADRHRVIFRQIASLANAGKPVDVVTVCESLAAAGRLENVGGLGYVSDLAEGVPTAANARRYAEIVSEKARRRRVIQAAEELSTACYGSADLDSATSAAEAGFAEILDTKASEPAGLSEVFAEATEYIEKRGEGIGGLRTGWVDFDRLTGGLEPGQLVVVAARPAMGKTVFACNLADHVAQAGGGVVFFSLEMPKREIGMRLLSARTNISVHAMRTGTKNDGDWSRMTAARVRSANESQRLWVDDTGAVGVPYIRARARRLQRVHGLDLIIVDYIGLMTGAGDNRVQQLGSISRGLKALAKELKVPIVALSQLNRGVTSRDDKRPGLADLRDSGEIEQDADIVAMLHREEYYRPDALEWKGVAEVLVRKNRNGPTGDALLTWFPNSMRFESFTGNDPRTLPPPMKPIKGRGFE